MPDSTSAPPPSVLQKFKFLAVSTVQVSMSSSTRCDAVNTLRGRRLEVIRMTWLIQRNCLCRIIYSTELLDVHQNSIWTNAPHNSPCEVQRWKHRDQGPPSRVFFHDGHNTRVNYSTALIQLIPLFSNEHLSSTHSWSWYYPFTPWSDWGSNATEEQQSCRSWRYSCWGP